MTSITSPGAPRESQGSRTVGLAFGALVFGIAVAMRLAGMEPYPRHDELYHIVAAHSWIADGTLAVGDGAYLRGALYTILLGTVYQLFGDDLFVARMLSIIIGSLWVAAVFLWTRARAGSWAAWAAALALCVAPSVIALSTTIRFYAPHALTFWLLATTVYELCTGNVPKKYRAPVGFLALLLLVTGVHLQIATLIGVAGLAAWMAVVLGPHILRAAAEHRAVRWGLAAAAAAVAVAGVAALAGGYFDRAWEFYQWHPAWMGSPDLRFYHWWLLENYPVFWGLFPVIALVALMHNPRPALFCLAVFGIVFVVFSCGGMQSPHYLQHVLPFLAVLCGIAISAGVTYLRRVLDTLVERAAGAYAQRGPRVPRGPLAAVTIAGILGFLVMSNPATMTPVHLLQGKSARTASGETPEQVTANWGAAREVLRTMVADASLVLTDSGLAALYYLGDYDIEFSPTHLSDVGEAEFTIDPRNGRPVISTTSSLRLLWRCFPSGLVIASRRSLHYPVYGFGPGPTSFLASHATEIPLPRESRLRGYRWDHAKPQAASPDCDRLSAVRTVIATRRRSAERAAR